MPIIKAITAPNGADVTFHKVMSAYVDPTTGQVSMNVGSWVDEATHNAGTNLVWMWAMFATTGIVGSLDATLATIAPFDGGTVVTDESESLDAVQVRQCALLDAAYSQAIASSVSFTTAAGVAHSYQADPDSVTKLSNCLQGWAGTQTVPVGFYWLTGDNTRIAFTYADLQGLAAAFINAGFAAFAALQDLKSAVRAATTLDAARAVVWPSPT